MQLDEHKKVLTKKININAPDDARKSNCTLKQQFKNDPGEPLYKLFDESFLVQNFEAADRLFLWQQTWPHEV